MALQNKAQYYDDEPREDISYNEKIEVFEKLHREWGPYLSVSEAKIVGWLLANTIVRGKRSGTYSYRQFVEGIPNHRDGGMWTEGTGMPIATVRRAVASCQKKGVIHKIWDGRGGKYTVQIWWDPVSGNAEDASVVSLDRSRSTRSRQI